MSITPRAVRRNVTGMSEWKIGDVRVFLIESTEWQCWSSWYGDAILFLIEDHVNHYINIPPIGDWTERRNVKLGPGLHIMRCIDILASDQVPYAMKWEEVDE